MPGFVSYTLLLAQSEKSGQLMERAQRQWKNHYRLSSWSSEWGTSSTVFAPCSFSSIAGFATLCHEEIESQVPELSLFNPPAPTAEILDLRLIDGQFSSSCLCLSLFFFHNALFMNIKKLFVVTLMEIKSLGLSPSS